MKNKLKILLSRPKQLVYKKLGALTEGDIFPHTTDFVLKFNIIQLSEYGNGAVTFRHTSGTTYIFTEYQLDGGVNLQKLPESAVLDIIADSAVANGNNIVIAANGTTITLYVNGVQKLTYTGASSLSTGNYGTFYNSNSGNFQIKDLYIWKYSVNNLTRALA